MALNVEEQSVVTPERADSMVIVDNSDGNAVKRVTYEGLITLLDGLYAAINHMHSTSDIVGLSDFITNNAAVMLNTAKVSYPGDATINSLIRAITDALTAADVGALPDTTRTITQEEIDAIANFDAEGALADLAALRTSIMTNTTNIGTNTTNIAGNTAAIASFMASANTVTFEDDDADPGTDRILTSLTFNADGTEMTLSDGANPSNTRVFSGGGNVTFEDDDADPGTSRTLSDITFDSTGAVMTLSDGNNNTREFRGVLVGRLQSIVLSNLQFQGNTIVENFTVTGAPGTQFNLAVVNTNPAGWLTSGALSATSGTIPADGTFEGMLTIPEATMTVDRTAEITATDANDPLNVVRTGLFRQQHTEAGTRGNLTLAANSSIVGTVATFSASVSSGDFPVTVELFDSDPRTGSPTALQTATLNAAGVHTFTSIDTSAFLSGDFDYFIRASETGQTVMLLLRWKQLL